MIFLMKKKIKQIIRDFHLQKPFEIHSHELQLPMKYAKNCNPYEVFPLSFSEYLAFEKVEIDLHSTKEYTIISEYDNSIANFGECGHFTHRIDVSKEGKITQKKLLKKRDSVNRCLTVD